VDYFYVEATDPKEWPTSGSPTIDGVGINPTRGVLRLQDTPGRRRAAEHFARLGKLRILDQASGQQAVDAQDTESTRCQATTNSGNQCKNEAKTDADGNIVNGYCALAAHQKLAEG
jgi:hypothetical protein